MNYEITKSKTTSGATGERVDIWQAISGTKRLAYSYNSETECAERAELFLKRSAVNKAAIQRKRETPEFRETRVAQLLKKLARLERETTEAHAELKKLTGSKTPLEILGHDAIGIADGPHGSG